MFTPQTYKLVYSIDEVKKTFAQYQLQTAEKELLTTLIRIEKNNGYNSITGAETLLKIRNATNWTKCTYTGLRPTETANFYYADLKIRSVKSLLVIYYHSETDKIEIRIAPQFYPHIPAERYSIVNEIIANW